MITITPKKSDDKIEFKIEDDVNKLGITFLISIVDFMADDGLDKVSNFIADYVNQNYICLHERRKNGLKVINTNGNN